MAGKRNIRIPSPNPLTLWAAFAALFSLGLLTTLVDLLALPAAQTKLAYEQRQRFTVQPLTREVSLGATSSEQNPDSAFDVGTKDEAPPPADAEPEEIEDDPFVPPDDTDPAPEAAVQPAPTPDATLPEGSPVLRTQPVAMPLGDIQRTKTSLVAAPAPEVTEIIDGKKLPKRGENEVIPSRLYAHPFKRKPEQVIVSFVVMDAGVDAQSTPLLMNLPPQVSIAYSPYTRAAESSSEHMRARGHEVWTMLPVMGERYPADDPGPFGLIAKLPADAMLERVHNSLAAVPGSVGVVLPPDEALSQQKAGLVPALKEVDARGMLVVSTNPTRSIDQIVPEKAMRPLLRRADLVLDPTPNDSQIQSRLAGLVDAAREKGEFMVVLSARPQSLEILRKWLAENPLPEPLQLAPLSAFFQARDVTEAKKEKKEADAHGEAAAKDEHESKGDDHGDAKKKEEKPKPKPVEKKKKELPQDKYLKSAGGEKSSGGH
jgi:polysaccharide deacetylase 2 family uncharacterized protein YibQ